MSVEQEIALRTFEEIQGAFPQLRCALDRSPQHVDLALEIPAQADLLFDVQLNLQNDDELHLCASALWVGWFPISDPAVVDAYREAVIGLLAGTFRILESRRGTRTVSAELQRPTRVEGAAGWETLTGTRYWSLPWPPRRQEIVQNVCLESPVA